MQLSNFKTIDTHFRFRHKLSISVLPNTIWNHNKICYMYTHLFKNVHVRARGHPFNFLMLTSTMTHITIRLPRSVTLFHIAWYVCRKEMRRHIKLSKTSFGRPVLEAFMTVITHVRRELN